MHFSLSVGPGQAVTRNSLEQLQTTVALANGLAAAGRTIDLSGLESATGLLCAQVLDLPPSEGQVLRPALLSLHASIQQLLASLQTTSL